MYARTPYQRTWTEAQRLPATVSDGLSTALPPLLALAALLLWWVSLPQINVRAMTDLGLVTVLPATVILSFGVIVASFCLSLWRERTNEAVLLLHILILIVTFYATLSLVEEAPRFQVTWRHVGIIEVITRTGAIDPQIDAYFNWPVFFVLSAFATQIAGFQSAISFVAWAPVVFNLLFLLPLLLILGALTTDRRVKWLGVFFFYLTNWLGQDYFSPQATTYFLHLVVLGILLTWFKARADLPRPVGKILSMRPWRRYTRWLAPPDTPNAAAEPQTRVLLLAITVVIYAAIVPSHQLTPFVTFASVLGLVIFDRLSVRGLPILMAVLLGTWVSYMSVAYLGGHIEQLFSAIGRVNDTVGSNVGERLAGSSGHLFVNYMRLGMTIAIWVLALLGGIRRLRAGRWDMTGALLAVAPFSMLALQSYGGEMILRVYLFALPFMAFFAASFFLPLASPPLAGRTLLALAGVSLLLLVGFLFARYGNERMDYVTTEETMVVDRLYEDAPAGSLLGSFSPDVPWKFRDYEKYKYATVTAAAVSEDANSIAAALGAARRSKGQPVYLVLTRGQAAHLEMFYGLAPGALERWESGLRASGKFREVFANAAGTVFLLTAPP